MATRKKEIVVHICNGCGADCDYPAKCLKCQAPFCYECCKVHGKEYKHSVWASGSYDGFYCHSCDTAAIISRDPLHQAYRHIAALRAEYEATYKDWELRGKVQEEIVKKFWGAMGR